MDIQSIVDKLNGLDFVKADIETGLVAMFKDDKWHLLSMECSTEDHLYIADYDEMRIGTVDYVTGKITYILKREEECITLYGEEVASVDTDEFISVLDDESHSYVPLEPGTCRVDNLYCDQYFDKIAKGTILQCKPSIWTVDHVHIINGEYVLISRESIKVRGDTIKIGGNKSKYTMYYDIETEYVYLANSKKKIYLININECLVGKDSQGLYKGFEFYDQKKYRGWIYEIDGIWLGALGEKDYERIYPYYKELSKNTKPAARISFEDA